MELVWALDAAAQPTSGSDLNPGKLKLEISSDLYAGFPWSLWDALRWSVWQRSSSVSSSSYTPQHFFFFLLGNWRLLCTTYWLKKMLSSIMYCFGPGSWYRMMRCSKVCILILSTPWQRALSIRLYLVAILIYFSGWCTWNGAGFGNIFPSLPKQNERLKQTELTFQSWHSPSLLAVKAECAGLPESPKFQAWYLWNNLVGTYVHESCFITCPTQNAQQSRNVPKARVSWHSSQECFEANLKEKSSFCIVWSMNVTRMRKSACTLPNLFSPCTPWHKRQIPQLSWGRT